MGPTASGKTALASELIQHLPLEIISVDSAMIYREMDIGTAKPSPDELKRAPHHLIDILNPPESYSASQFCEEALTLSKAIHARGKYPLLVGGTMMYFNALQQGLSVLPESNEASRAFFAEALKQHGLTHLYNQLAAVDPQMATKLHPNDTQRILRALEVHHLSGETLSSFWAAQKEKGAHRFVNLILWPEERAFLHARIAQRFIQMLSDGFVEEVEHLLGKWSLSGENPAMRCVGYRQVMDYLNGQWNRNELQEKGIAATRQLAKRQLTWLRSWPDARAFFCEQPHLSEVMALITEILDNSAHCEAEENEDDSNA
jgi:tRNA dimethylallyltransferase